MRVMKGKKTGVGCEAGAVPRKNGTKKPSEKTIAYAVRRRDHPEETKGKSLQIAGYAPSVAPCDVENRQSFQRVKRTLDQQREEAAEELGLNMRDQLAFFKHVRDTGKHSDQASMVSVSVNSAKVINDMLGLNAPKQLEVSAVGMFKELGTLTDSAIAELIDALKA